MKNVIFISPNFPTNYWQFCWELAQNGLNVLGIGDQPYDELLPQLKESLTEYYKVNTLEDYEEVYRAVAFFIFKYGRIDFLESNNEYWLERDAWLRTDFRITSGFQDKDLPRVKFKSRMKEYYAKAGIPAARWHLVDDLDGCRAFIQEVGYPVIVKPDNGVGAAHTYRLDNDDELQHFLECKDSDDIFIMEEYIHAIINSYDAIINSRGKPMFETGNVTPSNLMDVVNDQDNSVYYIVKDLPEDTRAAGRAAVKAFGVKSRFVHFEFFRLLEDHEGMGKKGDVVALEVNMRPCGGYSPDMMNFANSTNVYKIWADMVAFDRSTVPEGKHYFCGFVGRRDVKEFELDHWSILERYGNQMKMVRRVPPALSGAMGDQMYVANFSTQRELEQYFQDLLAPPHPEPEEDTTSPVVAEETEEVSKPEKSPVELPMEEMAELSAKEQVDGVPENEAVEKESEKE